MSPSAAWVLLGVAAVTAGMLHLRRRRDVCSCPQRHVIVDARCPHHGIWSEVLSGRPIPRPEQPLTDDEWRRAVDRLIDGEDRA